MNVAPFLLHSCSNVTHLINRIGQDRTFKFPTKVSGYSGAIACIVRTETHGQTGVEMEALTGVQVALLTIYDMCKAVDRGMVMGNVKLLEKHGGKSGDWVASAV